MGLTKSIETLFNKYLPTPFSLAVLLTVLALFLGIFCTGEVSWDRTLEVFGYWESGVWNSSLLVFAYQMMLILVLGHVLVLSPPVEKLISAVAGSINNTGGAAALVAVTTMAVAFFNWGLGLIFGALLARKVGEVAHQKQIPINYPLIGACGYLGLMVWHAGISGSVPIKIAEQGHLKELMATVGNKNLVESLPESISTSLTVFSGWNLVLFLLIVVECSVMAYFLGRKPVANPLLPHSYVLKKPSGNYGNLSEFLDQSPWLSYSLGLLVLAVFLLQYLPALRSLNITPNMLNWFMLGACLVLHGSVQSFLQAVEESIGDVTGILIQFPLYFGIMGIMGGSGMITMVSNFFASISNEQSFGIFTFLSAGLVNIFVPSGGGQWALQGPLVLETASNLGIPLPKAVMAIAYGDQLTNMLQPFWALPLLGITKLKAKEILPYTLMFMMVGAIIYVVGLLLI